MSDKKQLRMNISYDSALKIQVWGNSRGLTLPQACSAICEAFADENESVDQKLNLIIKLLSDKDKH